MSNYGKHNFQNGDILTAEQLNEMDSQINELSVNISETYTKSEIDTKITSAVHYKGTVSDYSSLPPNPFTGDMYNIQNADVENNINAGDNVVWSGTAWDIQSGIIDLSGKQDKLTVEDNIQISDKNIISATDTIYDDTSVVNRILSIENKESIWDNKQDKLTAGANITISDDGTISSEDGGKVDDVKINGISVVSNKIADITVPVIDTTLSSTSENAIQNKIVNDALNSKVGYAEYSDSYLYLYESSNKITQISKIYIQGNGDTGGLSENRCKEIIESYGYAVGSDFYTNSEIDSKLSDKQNKLIAGSNITISEDGKTISATNTVYDDKAISDRITTIENKESTWDGKQNKLTAGDGITISDNGVISITYADGDEVEY